MAQVFKENYAFQRLFYSVEALINLYYHTDRPDCGPLHFFQQREWKIIPCFAFGDEPFPYRGLLPSEKQELLELNHHFFGTDVLGRRRVDECLYFQAVGKNYVIEGVNRIIVPDERIASFADDLVKAAGLKIPVVPMSALPTA
jgi:hypothetical protein